MHPVSSALPRNGNVFYPTLRIVNNHVKKEVRESGKTLDLVGVLRTAGVTAMEQKSKVSEERDGSTAPPSAPSLFDTLAELEVGLQLTSKVPR